MPLDLVGKLHRTIYITGCEANAEEALVRLLMQRCGAVDGWDIADGRIIVVFASMNSMSSALVFNGLSFVNMTTHISLWKATDPPPKEAVHQLAITSTDATATVAEDDPESLARREEVRRRREALREALKQMSSGTGEVDMATYREERLVQLCMRQARALCALTKSALEEKRAELAEEERILSISGTLLQSLSNASNTHVQV